MPLRRVSCWIASRPTPTVERLIVVCVFLFIWGLDTHGTFAGSGDEPHYQMIAHSIVFDGDFDLANDYADPTNLVYAGTLEPGAHAIRGRNAVLRPVHDVGLPVLFAPWFALAYQVAESSGSLPPALLARARLTPTLVLRHLLSLAMISLTALLAVLLFRLCRHGPGTRTRACLWAVLCVLSPPVLSHAYLFFTELPSALIVAACWLALDAGRSPRPIRSALLGAAVGVLLLVHIRNVGIVFALSAVFVLRTRSIDGRSRHLLSFFVPLGLLVALRTYVNFVFWGSLLTSPHASAGPVTGLSATIVETVTRVAGLLIDQEHGLLIYAPIYLVALPGLLVTWRRDRRRCVEACALAAGYLVPILLPFTNRHGWDGGWSPAARFLVPVVPVLIVLGFGYLGSVRRVGALLAGLCAAQALLDVFYWSHPKVLWNMGTGRSALAVALSPRGLDVSRWLPSWHAPSWYSVVSTAVLAVLWFALSLAAVRHVDIGDGLPAASQAAGDPCVARAPNDRG